jgi:hypothetical protein
MTRISALAFSLALLAAAAVGSACAAPPENADPTLAPWFQSLKQPGTRVGCCSVADCRPVDSRIVGNHYEVLIGDRWTEVPPDRVLEHEPNPLGRAVACWTPRFGILCFVRPTEA